MRTLEDVSSGLVLCCLAVEYVSISKRFLPELLNFLLGILHLSVRDKTAPGRRLQRRRMGEGAVEVRVQQPVLSLG